MRISWQPNHWTYGGTRCPSAWVELHFFYSRLHTHGNRHCYVCAKHPESAVHQ